MKSTGEMGGQERGLATLPRSSELVLPLLSTLLGLLSVAALLRIMTGIPALILGLMGLRRLNTLPDEPGLRLRWGRRLAIAGMVLGGLGCLLELLGFLAIGLVRVGETGRRTTCINNLRQIGKALNLHHELGYYPKAVVDVPPSPVEVIAPWTGEPYPSRLSWTVSILPLLERPERPGQQARPAPFESLAQKFDPLQPWRAPANEAGVNTQMTLYLCPSHPHYDASHHPALGYYVGIAGLGADAAAVSRESPQAGFFGYERRISRESLLAGQAYTLVVGETTQENGPWAAGGTPTLRGLIPEQYPCIGPRRPFGGMHPGGANFLMADGSVRFSTERTKAQVLAGLATLVDDSFSDQ